jgi:O2-independent ubiquinone biosynthesis protein UbiV
MSERPLEICIGPLLFNWPAEVTAAFYEAIAANEAVDRVYLGEVVCGKRAPLLDDTLEAAAERLRSAGKQVVRSSLALPATVRERKAGRALAGDVGLIEVNDVSLLVDRAPGRAFVAGPMLNIYNEAAARELMARGCVRLCANVELSLSSIGEIARACPELEIEIFAYGRLPLALSGRCYHARAAGRRRDNCLYVCDKDPDGMPVCTLEGTPFLAVNGIQTISHGVQVIDQTAVELQAAGVRALRLSPHSGDMSAVISAYRQFADAAISTGELRAAVAETSPPGDLVSGYLHGAAGHELAGVL